MARIKIKSRNPTNNDNKLLLLDILCRKDIEISRIFNTRDGFVVQPVHEHDTDNLFATNTIDELTQNAFAPVMPPEIRAKKSIIIPRTDEIIYEKNVVEIGEEIARKNEWLNLEDIQNIYKFPNSPTIKVTFHSSLLAKKCTEKGLKAFKISIPGNEIKLETYVPIKCCMRCYTLETHYTNECPKSRDYKLCSECGTEGHLWHQCNEPSKKCVNCGEDHSALQMKCPKRKEILKTKRTQIKERENMTYSNITGSNITPKMPTVNVPTITKEEILKIHICVAHAQTKNQEKPGCYNNVLNKILTMNNLPNIIIPIDDDDVSPVQPLIGATSLEQPITGAMSLQLPQDETPTPTLEQSSSRQSSTSNLSKTAESAPSKKPKAKDLGLYFFTTTEKVWPPKIPTEELLKGIKNQKYKWVYSNTEYDEQQILHKIEHGEISPTQCFFTVGPDEFRKIRSGLIQERSPAETRDTHTVTKLLKK